MSENKDLTGSSVEDITRILKEINVETLYDYIDAGD